ncbi:MAG: hypothetical protein JNN20_13990 [Betaproteobacteria bacterium]|nr:hypothetical protein [Betaproteobacteria bacterium]
MTAKDSEAFIVTRDGSEAPSLAVLNDERQLLTVIVDNDNRDIYLEFSTRQALRDFALSLLQEATFGESGRKEFYPLVVEGKALVVEGVRLKEGSSRIFVSY